jgi:hypothetical protein
MKYYFVSLACGSMSIDMLICSEMCGGYKSAACVNNYGGVGNVISGENQANRHSITSMMSASGLAYAAINGAAKPGVVRQ